MDSEVKSKFKYHLNTDSELAKGQGCQLMWLYME
jgi:hypothetical protein